MISFDGSFVITPKEALDKYKEEVKKKNSVGAKGVTFQNLISVLSEFEVDILPKPSKDATEWQKERDKLMVAFKRILLDNNKKKTKKCLNFFDSAKYLNLCKVRHSKESHDKTFVVDDAGVVRNETSAKLGAPVQPLLELGKRQLNNRTKARRI